MAVSLFYRCRRLSFRACLSTLTILGMSAVLPANSQSVAEVVLPNLGGDMGGHTPRGFRGQGSGVFVGDNLNSQFPNGDGVQTFISFDLSQVTGNFQNATLSSQFLRVNGTPFADLGDIQLEQVEFRQFSSAIWDTQVVAGPGCTLAISVDRNQANCDLTEAVQAALVDGENLLQFRLRFDNVSDNDGSQDLALFYRREVNRNEGGVFTLTLR
jgi:hypothetical protein